MLRTENTIGKLVFSTGHVNAVSNGPGGTVAVQVPNVVQLRLKKVVVVPGAVGSTVGPHTAPRPAWAVIQNCLPPIPIVPLGMLRVTTAPPNMVEDTLPIGGPYRKSDVAVKCRPGNGRLIETAAARLATDATQNGRHEDDQLCTAVRLSSLK